MTVWGDGLLYREEGKGLHFEAADGSVRQLSRDIQNQVWLEPRVCGPYAIAFCRSRRTPGAQVESHVAVLDEDGHSLASAEGQSVSFDPEERFAFAVDRNEGRLSRIELETLESKTFALDCPNDLRWVPRLGAHPSGERVLLMGVQNGFPLLEELDLESGGTRTMWGPLSQEGWIIGAYDSNGRVVAVICESGEQPQSTVLLLEGGRQRTLFTAPRSLSPIMPVCRSGVAFLGLSFDSHPFATYGPIDLAAISLTGGSVTRLTDHGPGTGRIRALPGRVLYEVRDAVVSVPW